MGGQPIEPFGSGGYGVTYTTGNKGEPALPQIDPTQALNYFAEAGQSGAQGYIQGDQAYQAALITATNQINQGYTEANTSLQPLASASVQALTLFQQMLGITPAAPTAQYGTNLLTIDPKLTDIASLINQANNATDPAQRVLLNTQIHSQVSQAGGVTAAQAALNALSPPPAYNGATMEEGYKYTPVYQQEVAAQQAYYQQQVDNYNTQKTTDTTALSNDQTLQRQLDTFNNQWQENYNPAAPPQAFTGAQVAQQIEATPGYQFQLNQGNQQILRNQAAVGNLGTGQTQVALQNYGQNYAQNSYNGYMSNLQQLIQNGIPAQQQLASNQANQAGYLSNLSQLSGQVAYNADVGAGQAMEAAQMQEGNTAYNAAALNEQSQVQAWQTNQASQAQAMQTGTQLAGQTLQQSNQNMSDAGFYQGMNANVANASNSTYSSSNDNVSSNGGAV